MQHWLSAEKVKKAMEVTHAHGMDSAATNVWNTITDNKQSSHTGNEWEPFHQIS